MVNDNIKLTIKEKCKKAKIKNKNVLNYLRKKWSMKEVVWPLRSDWDNLMTINIA